mmetsp:Transcript_2964/g.4878  ORF Transcript_2964/g.4878 Transcript_2964/m.4878 type:complete len:215 (-) Transcript_2964:9-653(-)
MAGMARASLLLSALCVCDGLALQPLAGLALPSLAPRAAAVMMAKSKKPSRKKAKPAQSQRRPAEADLSSIAVQPSVTPEELDALPVEERVARVLREAGMDDADGVMKPAESTDPLSRIPVKGQALLERFFAGGAVTFGVVFILSGLAVALESICKVVDKPLPVAIDEALVQYVEPAMTPSVLILFGFSISLGLLKQLQMMSGNAGVFYSEDDSD